MPRLCRVDCHSPGITRRRCGRGFTYLEREKRISDPTKRARIQALTIPPAWSDVWICSDELGHLQAVGTDAAGRKQYLYHPRWRERRDREKFDRMLAFARALPAIREVTARQISGDGLTRGARARVRRAPARPGSDADRRRGIRRRGRRLRARDAGKATRQDRERHCHARLRRQGRQAPDAVLHRLGGVRDHSGRKRRRGGGSSLLAYENARWVTVRSEDINTHLKEIAGVEFSAKDFRTWHATVLAAIALAESPPGTSKAGRERAIVHAIEQAAERLGNTPAVCRASYVDPRLIERFRANDTIAGTLARIGRSDRSRSATRQKIERAVASLLA